MSETLPARVRFAPSPTGFLHLGGLRSALYNWLYARHTGGQFLLRIEDTDQKRYNPESLENLMRSLRWVGLEWDEGPDVGGPHAPYVQSERKELYRTHAEELIAAGKAYRCYTTPEELDALRKAGKEYDRRHRSLSDAERAALEAEGRPHVVRLAVPLEGATTFHDVVRGPITVENQRLPVDPVLIKGDGLPTYHLAVVVDDHDMGITHVLRGEEWLPSAPIHQLLYDAFGWTAPEFVHLPVILDPSGKGKMSKRKPIVDGKEYPVFVEEFMDEGYLPEAMFNFLANIGWNFDAEREIFTRDEAVARFEVADINPTAAAVPYSKLDWMNGIYIRALEPADLQERLVPFLSRQLGMEAEALHSHPRFAALIPLIQGRIKTLAEAGPMVDWAFVEANDLRYDDPALFLSKKMTPEQAFEALRTGAESLRAVSPFEAEPLEERFRALAEAAGIKVGAYFQPFRVALTGKTVSPPLFESMAVLGRAEAVRRVENAMAALLSAAEEAERAEQAEQSRQAEQAGSESSEGVQP
jgi:glutamyl-tRNA synthetase